MTIKQFIEKINNVGLTTKEATDVFAQLEKNFKELQKSMTYSAPEVIKQRLNEFLWSVYIKGRVDEKEDILKHYKQ